MPPLKHYTFKHKVSENISNIIITTHENLNHAYDILSNYVININEWEFIN